MSKGLILEEKYGSGGDIEISLNWDNSRNICCSEKRFSVFNSSRQALSNHVTFTSKLENLYNTFLWRH